MARSRCQPALLLLPLLLSCYRRTEGTQICTLIYCMGFEFPTSSRLMDGGLQTIWTLKRI
jgi:hypothetical protein